MIYIRKTIDKSLRDVLEAAYHPKNKFQWNLLVYIVYEMQVQPQIYEPIDLSSKRLSVMAGQEDRYKSKHFSAEPLLIQFSDEVIPLGLNFDTKITAYSVPSADGWNQIKTKPNTRRILDKVPHIDSKVTKAMAAVLGGKTTERVYIANGKKFSLRKIVKNVEEVKNNLVITPEVYETPIGQKVLKYMNSLKTNIFSKIIKKNISYARMVANRTQNPARELSVLEFIQHELPQPLYKGVVKSSRIFSVNQSIVSLKRDVRKALTVGWYEADLKNAQLAIIANQWGIKKLQKYLATGESFWKYLEFTGLEKDLLKMMTYSVCYGATRNRLILEAQEHGKTAADIQPFLEASLVKSILRARSKQFKKIKMDGGAEDYFGTFISLEDRNKRSILSSCAQSYELALLEPVFDWFSKKKNRDYGCIITLFQHDGFSFSMRPGCARWVKSVLKNLVERRAKELGFSTSLEIEKNMPKLPKKKVQDSNKHP